MNIINESQFKIWYSNYIANAVYAIDHMTEEEFKIHLAEAFMSGYIMGSQEIDNDN